MAKSKSLIIGVLCVGIVVILLIVMAMRDNTQLLSAQEAQSLLTSEEVRDVSVDNDYIYFVVKDTPYKVYLYSLPPKLWSYELPINVKSAPIFGDILGEIGIVVLVLLVLSVLIQAVQSRKRILKIPQKQQNDIMRESEIPFTESSYMPMSSSVRFKDVAGISEVKEELVEIIDYLKNPKHYQDLGITLPKGVLLVGPPGVGKTMIAKAVAGEAAVPFFYQSGSSFVQIYVGMGAKRVRELFARAKARAPSIIFIDEIDAIGKSRAAGSMVGGNDEREQTLNQLLAEMDGFGSESAPVIVLAATNRPEILDPALLRPGRFDRQVLVDKPDFEGRLEILKVHIKNVSLARDVDLHEIAKFTAGLAGADLANIINEAALLAGRENQKEVSQKHLKEAVERGIAGLEKKSRRISPKEKKIVAYHESGHAVVSEMTKGADRVNKVSIIPRGMAALGYTLHTPEENRYLMQKHELMAEVDVLLGGRAAEEVFLGEISTGASNDLERATGILKSMISYYGMTDVSGLMVLEKQRNTFLGGGGAQREFSEQLAQEIDTHIKNTLDERYTYVKNLLRDYREAIENMVKELFDKEVIDGARVREIIEEYEAEHNLQTRLIPLEEEA